MKKIVIQKHHLTFFDYSQLKRDTSGTAEASMVLVGENNIHFR